MNVLLEGVTWCLQWLSSSFLKAIGRERSQAECGYAMQHALPVCHLRKGVKRFLLSGSLVASFCAWGREGGSNRLGSSHLILLLWGLEEEGSASDTWEAGDRSPSGPWPRGWHEQGLRGLGQASQVLHWHCRPVWHLALATLPSPGECKEPPTPGSLPPRPSQAPRGDGTGHQTGFRCISEAQGLWGLPGPLESTQWHLSIKGHRKLPCFFLYQKFAIKRIKCQNNCDVWFANWKVF